MNLYLLTSIVLVNIRALECNVLKFRPIHASCNIEWNFGISCHDTLQRIVAQINNWTNNTCNNDEKCGYKITDYTESVLHATHTTPVKHYIDNLSFTFQPDGQASCKVHGFSTSQVWYAILDYSTNYCNLHNLIIGSGLNKTKNYSETTSDTVCTQYSSRNCEKY